MGFRSALLKFVPLVALMFACTSDVASPTPQNIQQETKIERRMSYFPEKGYRRINENTWFANNPGLPYNRELEGRNLTWRDAVAYNNGEYIAITESGNNGLDDPLVVHVDNYGETKVVFGERFPNKFRNMLIDGIDVGMGDPEEEIVVTMSYADKESVLVIDPFTKTPVFWYESDDVNLINSDGENIVTGTTYGNKLFIEAYRWNGSQFVKTEVPKEIRPTEEMLNKLESNREKILYEVLTNPSQAVKTIEKTLGTDNPYIISTALQATTRNAYVVSEEGSSPLWKYVEFNTQSDEVGVRVSLDPLATYFLITKFGGSFAQTPLPWAENKPLVVVVTDKIAEGEGNTYLNLRLVRDENGQVKFDGDIEPGQRLVKIIDTVEVYAPIAAEKAQHIQKDIDSGVKQTAENFKKTLEDAREAGERRLDETANQAEELKKSVEKTAREKSEEVKREIGKRADDAGKSIREYGEKGLSSICEKLPMAPGCK